MPTQRGSVTAHVARVAQDSPQITALLMSEAQVLELMSVLTVGLREKAFHADGLYRLALWKDKETGHVVNCQANPPCTGGDASIALVRRGKS